MTTNRNIGVSLTADPSQMQAGLRTASSAAQQFAATTNEAFGRASTASARLAEASKGVAAASSQQTLAARAHQAAADRFVRDLERQAVAVGKTRSELLALQAAELGVADRAAPLIARLRESERALGAGAEQMSRYGMSVAQTANVMRMVPAQITDIVVSLQAGQSPMTVMLQQGGQMRDMFGSVGNAAHALGTTVLNMVNPYVLAAAAVASLFVAYHQGARELDALQNHLTMTGNALGATSGQVSDMAARLDNLSNVTRGGAVKVLTEIATSGKVAGDQLETVGEIALRSAKLLGRETTDVVSEFAKLAEKPSEAAVELNKKYNFLTASVHQQILALEDQGRVQEAARLAQETWASASIERLTQVEGRLGILQRAWGGITGAAKEAWDAMLDVGREKTISDRLKAAVEEQNSRRVLGNIGWDPLGAVARQDAVVASLRAQLESEEISAGMAGALAEQEKALIAANESWRKQGEGLRTRIEQRDEEIANARKWANAVGASEQELADRITAINKKYKENGSGGISATQTELARLRAAVETEKQREEQLHSSTGALASLNEHEKAAIQYGEKLKLVTNEKTKAQLLENKALAEEAGARKRANDSFDKELKERESAIDAAKKQTLSLRDQIETYGMGRSAVEAMTIARLEERIAMADPAVSEAQIDSLKRELAARRELYDAMRTKESLDAQLKEWQTWEREVDRIFGQLGQSLTDQLFEGGVNARDLLKDLFKSMVFRVAVQPVMGAMQGWVTNQLGGMFGMQNPQQQGGGANTFGMAQNASSLYSAMTGGISTTMGNGISWLGAKLGSEALSAFGLGMSGAAGAAGTAAGIQFVSSGLASTMGAAAAPGAYTMASVGFEAALGGAGAAGAAGGAAGAAGTAGAVGTVAGGGAGAAGAALAAAAPWVLGGLAVAGLLGGMDFGGETRKGGTYVYDHRTGRAAHDGGWIKGMPSDQVSGAVNSMVDATAQQINSILQAIDPNVYLAKLHGEVEDSEKDRGGVSSGGVIVGAGGLTPEDVAAQTYRAGQPLSHQYPDEGGIQFGTFQRGQGFGPDSGSLEEMIQYLAVDLQQTTIQALQSVSHILPETLKGMVEGIDAKALGAEQSAAVVAQIQAVVQGVTAFQAAVEQLPFENLKGLAFDAAASLIQLAGGVDQLIGAQQTYLQQYYTEAERYELSVGNLTAALSAAGVEMPELVGSTQDMLAQYRALVEAQDINTEAGRQAYVTLMQTAGAFAEVAQYAGTAAEAVRNAADVAREREGLERQLLGLQGNTAELRRRELEVIDPSNRALQEQIWAIQDAQTAWADATAAAESSYSALSRSVAAEKTRIQRESQAIADALRNSISAASTTVSELTSLTGRLTSTVQRMAGQLDEGRSRAWAQERVERALSVAKLTGVMPQGADFEAALQLVAQPSEGLFQSFEDYQADFLKTAHTVNELNDLADTQLSTEKRALRALEEQLQQHQYWQQAEMDRLDAMLDHYREQIEIEKGTHEAVLSLPDAIARVVDAIGSLAAAQRSAASVLTGKGGGTTTPPTADTESSAPTAGTYGDYVAYLTGNRDLMAAYLALGGGDYAPPEQWARDHWETFGQFENRPVGLRSFDVGTSYVPNDMLANIHRGEIIIDPRSSDILRRYGIGVQGGGSDQMVRLLQQEIREMRAMLERKLDESNSNTRETARTNRQMADQRQIVQVEGPVATVLVEDRTT